MTVLARSDKLAFALLCKARIDHERADHGYDHQAIDMPTSKYDWGKAKRHVLAGQGW